ncbi:AMP-binding protein [Streptomyces sp. 8N706]|uniref:AMP-binding protein n=1 Tax=Streptomyces sp. 8N706 TaxID=3457416 RepID=UPI003FD5C080
MDWNGTETQYPADALVHRMIAQQAALTPQATAVVAGVSLSWREVNEKANQLACHLGNLGVGPGSLVAVCVDHGVQLVVALLGVLKAVGAYRTSGPGLSGGAPGVPAR